MAQNQDQARKKKGPLDYLNNVVDVAQGSRRVVSTFGKVRTAATAVSVAATSEVWGPLLFVLAAVLAVLVIIVIVFFLILALSGFLQPGGGQPGFPGQPTATPLPPGSQVLCPVPGGMVTCGSSLPNPTHYSACLDGGHCVGNYPENQWCAQFPGTYYAADVSGSPGTDVYLPHLTIPGTGQAHALTCLFVGAYPGVADPSEDITQFNCVDGVDGRNYWLNFHHIRHGTGPSEFDRIRQTEFHSGEAVAGKIDQTHVHIQIGIDSPCGGFSPASCVPTDQYIKC